MSDAIEIPKTYEEGLRDGFLKGQEEANKVMEQMLHTTCNPVVYALPETEAIKTLQKQIQKMKTCGNCKHCYQNDYENLSCDITPEPYCSNTLGTVICDKWELSN